MARGEYSLRGDGVETEAVIASYRDFDDVAVLTITVRTDRTTTVYTQLIECSR